MFFVSALAAADQHRLGLLAAAQAAFDRLDGSAPQLAAAADCVQAQAATLAVALPAEQADLNYRKGFCQLAVAAVTRAPAEFTAAAAQLDLGGAHLMAWIARQAGQAPAPATWVTPDNCPASCQPFVRTAHLWLAWLALQRGELDAAARDAAQGADSGWPQMLDGLRAFQTGRYRDAAARYQQALDLWMRDQQLGNPSLALRLAPPASIANLLTDLGGARMLSGDVAGALLTLDRAAQLGSPSAQVFFLRARARELAGQSELALADYNLASRTAFANATGLASGEAHLYRGILLYRRKDYARAEEEFASALNFEIPPALRPDASAWRHLAAVAAGSCAASRQHLDRALASVSPYFPKDEARGLAAACGTAGAL